MKKLEGGEEMKHQFRQTKRILLWSGSIVLFLFTCFLMMQQQESSVPAAAEYTEKPEQTVSMKTIKAEDEGFLTGSITITKRISAKELEKMKQMGMEPVFLFWLDEYNLNGRWVRRICQQITFDDGTYTVDQDGYASVSFLFDQLDRGTYRVREIEANPYTENRCGSISANGRWEDGSVVFEIGEATASKNVLPDGSVVFVTKKEIGKEHFHSEFSLSEPILL
jgi:hypothetical protein